MKRLLFALSFLFLPVGAMAATVTQGSQIDRNWSYSNINSQTGLKLLGGPALLPVFSVTNAASKVTYKVNSNGSVGQSGSLLIGSGGTTMFADAVNRRVGIKILNPKVPLEVLGQISGSSLVINGTTRFNNIAYTWPAADGSNGQALATNGAGTLSFVSLLPAANTTGTGALNKIAVFGGQRTLSGAMDLFYVFSTKNVGIGKSSPAAKLDVVGTVSGSALTVSSLNAAACDVKSTNGVLSCGVDAGTTYTAGQGLSLVGSSFRVNSNLSGSSLKFQTISGATLLTGPGAVGTPSITFGGDQNTGLYWISSDTLGIATGGLERLRIDSAGSVEIGTANSTTAKLSVVGTISGSTVVHGIGSATSPSVVFNGDTNTGLYWIGPDIIGISTGGAEKMRIDSSGNVGIGTTPKTKLEVEGTLSGAGLVSNGRANIPRPIPVGICDWTNGCSVETGSLVPIPPDMDNCFLSGATIFAGRAGATGVMTVQLRNLTTAVDIFSTPLSLGSARLLSGAVVINSANRVFHVNDRIVPVISAVHTTPAKDVTVLLSCWPAQ